MADDFPFILRNSTLFDTNKKQMLALVYEGLSEEDKEKFRNTFMEAEKEAEKIAKDAEKEKSDARKEFIEGIKKDYKEAYDSQVVEFEQWESKEADKILEQM